MTTVVEARPFVKWAGGKQGLADTLIRRFPTTFDRYFEPFLGGGSVFFQLGRNNAVLSDQNDWLIETYEAVRDDWKAVAEILDTFPNTREDFLRIRSINPKTMPLSWRAASFIFLNKTCFRGLFRVNRSGQFNVPYGEYARRYYAPEELAAAAARLRTVELRKGCFELGISGITAADFVYFDPPYYKFGGYSDFNRYTSEQFREQHHIRLAAVCRELDNAGIRWVLSNSDTPFVRDLYSGFIIKPIEARREINLRSGSRCITELLITNMQGSE